MGSLSLSKIGQCEEITKQIERTIEVVGTIKGLTREDGRRLDKVSTMDRLRAKVYEVEWQRFDEAEKQLQRAMALEVLFEGTKSDVDAALFV